MATLLRTLPDVWASVGIWNRDRVRPSLADSTAAVGSKKGPHSHKGICRQTTAYLGGLGVLRACQRSGSALPLGLTAARACLACPL